MAPAHAFNYHLLWLKHKQIETHCIHQFHSWLALLILLLHNANQTLACSVLTPTGLPTSLQEMSMAQMWTHICDIFNVSVCCCMETAQKQTSTGSDIVWLQIWHRGWWLTNPHHTCPSMLRVVDSSLRPDLPKVSTTTAAWEELRGADGDAYGSAQGHKCYNTPGPLAPLNTLCVL